MSDQEITIQFGDVQHTLDIEDVTSDDLKDLFHLDFDVKHLIELHTGKTVLIKKQEKLKPGLVYLLPDQASSSFSSENKGGEPPLSNWLKRNHELIQNALIVSNAIYEVNPRDYLADILADHNLKSVLYSQNGKCRFLVSEELNENRVYIAFRGTDNLNDVREDLRVYQKATSQGRAQGRFHAGFLSRAEMFPLEKIISSDMVRNKKIIVCGHSLGGAVSSIVATEMLLEKERTKNDLVGDIINITFGAPLFGDEAVRKFLTDKTFANSMFHIVAENDPVPCLLSFAQSVSAIKFQVDKQIDQLVSKVSTVAGQSYVVDRTKSLVEMKDTCVNFLAKVEPYLSPAIDLAAAIYPTNAIVLKGFKEGIDMVSKGMDKTGNEEVKRKYVPVGNFFFICNDFLFLKHFNNSQVESIVESLDMLKDVDVESMETSHRLTNYQEMCKCNACFHPGAYLADDIMHLPPDDDGNVRILKNSRNVKLIQDFEPKIHSAELATVESQDVTMLRLVLIGENLFQIYLPNCSFDFGFPFGKDDKVTVKKIGMGSNAEKVVIEQEVKGTELSVSDHGSNIIIATQFGFGDIVLPRKNIRNIEVQSVSQMSRHESISLIIKKSVQRGMALSQLKKKTSLEEPLVSEILKLTEKCLQASDHDKLVKVFSDKNIQFILSNEQEYKKVSDICDKIEKYMMSPLKLNAEKSTLQVISVGALAVLGGGAMAYMAGPGLLLVGAIEALNITGVGAAATFGTLSSGYFANRLLTEAIADQNYIQVLKWLKTELFSVWSERVKIENPEKLQQVSDLCDDDTVYSNEKALLLMFNKDIGVFNFEGSKLEQCTVESKNRLIQRIECVEIIHRIRDILASQCFIGIVGLQDSGKTTLLNKIWGFKGSTGLFAHTDVPVMHQITKKVSIIDFPGSNSLDYHAKTFSICGAMNNMIIVLVPFTGDVSEIVSRELAKVYEAMVGTESSRIIICVNKTGLHLEKLKNELKMEANPIDFMKQRYITKLNEHFTDTHVKVKTEHIFFTDWEIGDDGRSFGIEGIDEIKEVIKQHLIELNVVKRPNSSQFEDSSELEDSVSPPKSFSI